MPLGGAEIHWPGWTGPEVGWPVEVEGLAHMALKSGDTSAYAIVTIGYFAEDKTIHYFLWLFRTALAFLLHKLER